MINLLYAVLSAATAAIVQLLSQWAEHLLAHMKVTRGGL